MTYVISAEGLNRARLLGALAGGGVTVRRVSSGEKLVFSVRKKDLSKAVAILDAMCYNYEVKSVFSEKLRFLLLRLPLAVAAAVMAVVVFASNFFVWRVEVEGVDGTLRLDVLAAVRECGVAPFTPRGAVDERTLASAVRECAGVTDASVTLDGSVLKVYVLTADEPEDPDGGGEALVSAFDGVITRMVVESGTPLVAPGDVVRRGDTLVSGDILSVSDGSVIGKTEVRARVYAQVTFGYSYPFASSSSLTYTGNEYVSTVLSLFGLTIGGGECPFGIYDAETESATLFPLPVTVTRTVYRELALAETETEAIEDFMLGKREELSALLGSEFSERRDIVSQNGVAVLKAYFTAEICIGEI